MTTIVTEICKGLSYVFTAADIAAYVRANERDPGCKNPVVGWQAVGVVVAIAEGGAKLLGASNKTLKNIKSVEVIAKIFEACFNFENTPFEPVERPVLINFLVNKVAAPAASVLRVCVEFSKYQQKAYLDMAPEELAKHTDRELTVTGWKEVPITKEKCKEDLQQIERDLPKNIIAETVLKSYTLFSTGAYHELGKWATALAERCGLGGARDQFDLLAFGMIPEALYNDPVFAAHICPITLCPIRHPVGDPDGFTIYERDAIIEAIAHDPRSPITHAPLRERDLIQQPALQAAIDAQLSWHEERLRREMAANPVH